MARVTIRVFDTRHVLVAQLLRYGPDSALLAAVCRLKTGRGVGVAELG